MRMPPWRRMTGFLALPLISVLSPLFVLPVLTRVLGAEGWTSIAIGQSIGLTAALVINFGWGVVGPARVAQATADGRGHIYRVSWTMRLAISVVALPVAFLVAELIDQDAKSFGAGLMAVAAGVGGLAPVWYFIGSSQPRAIATYDTLPRLASSLLALPALLLIPSVYTYPVILLIVMGGAATAAAVRLSSPTPSFFDDLLQIRTEARLQWPLVVSGLISSGYTSLSVSFVAIVNLPAVASFAAATRIRAIGQQGASAVGNAFQGWVAESEAGEIRARMLLALSVTSGCGLLGGTAIALSLPLFDTVIFGPEIEISAPTAIFTGLALLFTATSLSTSFHVLAPLGRSSTIAVATGVGALVGIPALFMLSATLGAPGGALAAAIAEAVVLLIEGVVVWQILRPKGTLSRAVD